MPQRNHHPGKFSHGISALLAGFFIATISIFPEAQAESLDAKLKQLGYAQIELRRTGENHVFLFGRVNGRRRSCLVDTGWSFTTISTNTPHRLDPPGMMDELKLGCVTLTNEPAVVQDLRVNGQPTAFDVVLGCDFLIRHHAVIDCADRRLYLRRETLGDGPKSDLVAALEGRGFIASEMIWHDPLALTCLAKLNGRDVELLVDTGAMWSCLDADIARVLELPTSPSANQITSATATGKRGFGVTKVKSFAIGRWEKVDMSFAVLELADWGLGVNGKTLKSAGGILGGDELAASAVIIDCGQRKLWLRGKK